MSEKNQRESHGDPTPKPGKRKQRPTLPTPRLSGYAVDIKMKAKPLLVGEAAEAPQEAQDPSEKKARKSLQWLSVAEGHNPFLRLSERIKLGRKKQGWTQQQLADAVGVHISFIAHLETFKENGALPSYSRTSALERVLELDSGELWKLVEAVRALMDLKRARAIQKFKELELELQGIRVSSPSPDPTTQGTPLLDEEYTVNPQEYLSLTQLVGDFGTIIHNRAEWANSSSALREMVGKMKEKRDEPAEGEDKETPS